MRQPNLVKFADQFLEIASAFILRSGGKGLTQTCCDPQFVIGKIEANHFTIASRGRARGTGGFGSHETVTPGGRIGFH